MNWKPWTCAVLTLCLLAGCGDKADDSATAGPTVKVAYDYGVGDGVRMTLTTKVEMEMPGGAGPAAPMEMTMVIRTRCSKVHENGEKELEFLLEQAGLPAGADAPPGLEGMKGTATVGVDGRMKEMSFEGVDPTMEAAFKKSMAGGGLPSMVPIPPEGLRVGDAIDMKDMYPEGMLDDVFAAVPGAKTTSTMDGKLVFLGTKMIDGAEAAEFSVSMVMTMSMDMEVGTSKMRTETKTTSTGGQFIDLKTGFPVGESHLTGTSEMTMSGGPDATERQMKSTTTTTCICERLK